MGVDTCVNFVGGYRLLEIVNWLKENYVLNSEIRVVERETTYGTKESHSPKDTYDDSSLWTEKTASIIFVDRESDLRALRYCYSNCNFHDDIDYYDRNKDTELIRMIEAETSSLMTYYTDEAVLFMMGLATDLNGWIDINDCDDQDFFWCGKDSVETALLKQKEVHTIEN